MRVMVFSVALVLALLTTSRAADTPYLEYRAPLPGLTYLADWFEQADHDPALPTPEAILDFPVGSRAASPAEITRAITRWAEASDRAVITEYARSHEDRPLHYLVISSPANLSRLDAIKAGMATLADPRESSSDQIRQLVDTLPAVAWLGYSIHGNESSGADAALAVIHHLLADRSEKTQSLLDEVVVIIDPAMNPDGRQRFVQDVAQYRSQQANVDDQSMVHAGQWPYGRGNHYFFDLNRDWIYGIQPETRGRIRAVREWHPILFVDAHEMGAQDSYLFSPARPPHNPNFPPYRYQLGAELADEMAAGFDALGYPYYSGEWADEWYPGYSDAWAALRGAQGVLYEQARLADDGVQQRSKLISYPQGVHQQVIATMANLESLRQRRKSMLGAFVEDRQRVVGEDGPYAEQHFLLVPGGNEARARRVHDLIELQGLEAQQTSRALRLRRATDRFGQQLSDVAVPAGSVFLRGNQPAARVLAAMFEFDPRIGDSALRKERESLLGTGETTFYDTTAWNIAMMFDVEAYQLDEAPGASELEPLKPDLAAVDEPLADALAYALGGETDAAPALAGRLMQRGVTVRISNRASRFGGVTLPRGSVVVSADDNRALEDWRQRLFEEATALGVSLTGIHSARADTMEDPDLGGSHFVVANRPRVALFGQGETSVTDFGSLWHVLDRRLGLRHGHLDVTSLASVDLRRYNVLVFPDGAMAGMDEDSLAALQQWVRAGGTLIASGDTAAVLAGQDWLSTVVVEDALDDPDTYSHALLREVAAGEASKLDMAAVWQRHSEAALARVPWADLPEPPSGDELRARDDWQSLFMPSGALLAARVDTQHWLTAGSAQRMPVYMGRSPVLHTQLPAQAPVRLGVYEPAAQQSLRREGWVPVPAGKQLRLRMSGLVWPEARVRLASAAWMSREAVGDGQVILFPQPPAFRGAAIATIRLFENAVVYGPGLGASQPISLP